MGALQGRGIFMGKVASKKGIFFTFISITMMIIFILVFTPQADISLQKDTQSIRLRIDSIDNYIDDLENRYFENVLRATTYKTMLSLIFYINSTGAYLPNLDSAFSEVLITGNINNVPIDSITGKKIMDNNTFTNWSNRIAKASKETLSVNTTIAVNNVTVYQTEPWAIDSKISLNFSVKSSIAEWKKDNVIIITSIDVEGFYDPYYLVNTNKVYTNQIKKSSVEFDQWNTTIVREHLRNGTYAHWDNSDAPSFLMRFTNTITNSSCCGIESIVNPNKIIPNDQIDSYADYFIWTNKYSNNCTFLYNITGLWGEFRYVKLDLDHVIKYNISAQDAVRTC